MSRFRIIGMDWFEVVVHVGVTFMTCVATDALLPGHNGEVGISVVVAASMILLAMRRRKVLAELPESPASQARMEEVDARLGELDQMHDRLTELEDRLDFAERMMAQHREQDQLSPGPR